MKPTKSQRTKWGKGSVITFDIEAYNWVNPVALGMFDGSNYTDFIGSDCIDSFMREAMKPKHRNNRFIAHNGGNYDFGFIIEWAQDMDFDFHFLEKQNSIFYIKIWDNDGKPRHFQDSLDLLMSSLGRLAPEFSSYEKMDFDFNKIEPIPDMSTEDIVEMREYLEIDTKALYESLMTFTDIITELSNGEAKPQLTIGSTTMEMYRSVFQTEEIPPSFQPDNDNDYAEMMQNYKNSAEYDIRKSYYGGRTEVYKMYGEDLNHYDVNSLFPYIYTKKQMPVGKPKHYPSADILDMDNYGGVAKIEGVVPEIKIPVLPVRTTINKQEKVIFPTGEISGWYTLSEIRYALRVGALTNVDVLDGYVSRYGRPFEQYGETLYGLKKTIDGESEPAKYWVVKLLLNSFYGKFALDREQENYIKVDNPLRYMMENDTELIPINELLEDKGLFKEFTMSQAQYIIPRIASEITAKARIEMHKWFNRIGYENIWYCDTDSIVTDKTIETGEDLGEMDLENKIEKGYFIAPKVYAELTKEGKSRTKAKGMRNNPNPFYAFEKAFEDEIPELISANWEAPKGVMVGLKESGKMVTGKQSRTVKQFDNKREHIGRDNSVPLSV